MNVSFFSTGLGWFALLGGDGTVERLLIGHRSLRQVRAACKSRGLPIDAETDWNPQLRMRLQQYAEGEQDCFADITVRDFARSRFQRLVLRTVRGIHFGHTLTYSDVAARSGSPGAARAVGGVMARNRVPIVIPCHRVVAAGGLGGFSAPEGLRLKRRMLELEHDPPHALLAHG